MTSKITYVLGLHTTPPQLLIIFEQIYTHWNMIPNSATDYIPKF